MNRKKLIAALFGLLLAASLASAGDYTKIAQTGFQFLSVLSDARGTALAGALTTDGDGANSLYYNPAGMALQKNMLDLSSSYNPWLADINYTQFALSFSPAGGRYGVFGASLQNVDYGQVEGTMPWANDVGYIDTDVLNPSAIVAGVGYARSLSAQFSIGAQVKYAAQQFGSMLVQFDDSLGIKKYTGSTMGIDFGTLFDIGYKGIKFGMSVRNFSQAVVFEDKPTDLPMTFTMGLRTDVFSWLGIQPAGQNLLLALDAVHPRSHAEYINMGFEYSLMNYLYVRYGLMQGQDIMKNNIGFGLNLKGIEFDYSYSPIDKFDDIQKFSIHISL